MRIINKIRLILIVLVIFGIFLLPNITSSASSPPAQVTVLPSNQTLMQGETIDMAILIDPMGTYIAGAKFDIAFNRYLLKVNKITEGNIFKQNGANTFFNSGVLNNSDGTVTSIFDIILGNTNVSNPGTFILINFTVINSSGSSEINLSNMEISDPNGFLIVANVTNGTIKAKMAVLPEIRFINGTVKDNSTGNSLAGVTVSANSTLSTMTDATGYYSFAIAEGTYDLTAAFDITYHTNITTASTVGRAVVCQDIELIKKPTGNITGSVAH